MPTSWTPVTDGVDDVLATHVNTLYDEVELGTFRGWYANTQSSSDDVTLTDADLPIQYIDPSGNAINVYLPAAAGANHAFIIVNTADAAETITVLTSSSDTVDTVAQNEARFFVSDDTTWAALSGGAAVSNLLINGGFDFFQRIVPTTPTAMSDDAYNAPDRWYSLVQGANATINRNAGIGKSQYSCKLVAGGTTNRYGIAQIVEASNSIPMRGQTVIAQCLIKPVNNAGSGTRKYRIAILEWTGTADAVTSELVADWTSSTFTTDGFFASTTKTLVGTATVTATHNTETLLSVSGVVSNACNNLIVFVWTEDAPTHANDYVLIGEAGLYTSPIVQNWNPSPIQQQLSLCQRYYQKSYSIEVAPGTVTWYGSCRGYAESVYYLRYAHIEFKTEFRSSPTVSPYSNATGAINKWRDSEAAVDLECTALYQSTSGTEFYSSTGALTIGRGMMWHWVASAEL